MQFDAVTLNIHNQRDGWLARRAMLLEALTAAPPMFIALQEVNVWGGQAWTLARALNGRLGRDAYTLAQHHRRRFVRGWFDGVAVLCRRPLVHTETVDLGYDGRVAQLVTAEMPSGHTVDFVSVQLAPARNRPGVRREQVLRLSGWLSAAGRSPYQIIGGDFGDGPEQPAVQQMMHGYRSAYAAAHGRHPVATYPTALAYRPGEETAVMCRDYLFINADIDVEAADLFGRRPHAGDDRLFISTHVGVRATLKLRQPAGGCVQ